MEKYTRQQWAAMEGGHTVEDAELELASEYEFIKEITEARMFRTRDQIAKQGARNLTDHLFVGLMSLYAMSNDYKYAPVAKEYAKRTAQFGNFNRPSPSGTDLYQTLYSIQRPEELMPAERDKMLMNKVKVDMPRIKRFLNNVKRGNVSQSEAQQFFFKLERDLKIQDPKLRAARRLTQDWEKLSTQQRQLVGTQLNRYYRMNARRSDLNPLFSNFAKDENLLINDQEKKSIKQRIVRGIGAFAAGYAVGKVLPS